MTEKMEPLPKNWIKTKIKDLLQVEYGKSLTESERADAGEFPVVGSSGIVGYHNQCLIEGPSLVIGRKGSVGSLTLLEKSCWPIDTVYYVQPVKGLDIKYIYYQLLTKKLGELDRSTTIPGLNRDDLYEVDFLLCGTDEQTRIVEKLEELLSDLDDGVAELKAAQAKLTQYRQSLLKSAVEGSLTAEWRTKNKPTETGEQLLKRILTERRKRWEKQKLAEFEEKGQKPPKDWQKKYPEPVAPNTNELPELPEGWFVCDLEIFMPPDGTGTKTGPFGSLLKKYEHQKEGVPVVGIENIKKMTFVYGSKIHITIEKADELSDYELQGGDIIISRSGTVGEVCVIPKNLGVARFSTNIIRLRVDSTVMRPEYFCLVFNADKYVLRQVRELCVGSTRDFLNTKILKSLIFRVPPICEQDEILRSIEVETNNIDPLFLDLVSRERNVESQQKNILKDAFLGNLVDQNPNDEPASLLLEKIKVERELMEKQPRPKLIKKKNAPQKVSSMKSLFKVLQTENGWVSAQKAFEKAGVAKNTSTDRIEELYLELRMLKDEGKVEVRRIDNGDELRIIGS